MSGAVAAAAAAFAGLLFVALTVNPRPGLLRSGQRAWLARSLYWLRGGAPSPVDPGLHRLRGDEAV
jgi:hypothetical protein